MMTHGKDKLKLIKIRHTHTTQKHRERQWQLYYIYTPTQSVMAKILLMFDEIYLNITYSAWMLLHTSMFLCVHTHQCIWNWYERIFIFLLCATKDGNDFILFASYSHRFPFTHNVQRIEIIMLGQQHFRWYENLSVKFSTSKTSINIVFNKHTLSPSTQHPH